MVYSIKASLRAETEIQNAIDYYSQFGKNVPKNFVNSIEKAFILLSF
jgi:hypothetical protein